MPRPRRDGQQTAAAAHYARQLLRLAGRVNTQHAVQRRVGKRKAVAGGDAEIDMAIALRRGANSDFRYVESAYARLLLTPRQPQRCSSLRRSLYPAPSPSQANAAPAARRHVVEAADSGQRRETGAAPGSFPRCRPVHGSVYAEPAAD